MAPHRRGFSHAQAVVDLPLGLGLLIALIACFASWTPAMVRRWHADPFGFLRPWGEVPALMGSAPPPVSYTHLTLPTNSRE